MDFDRELAELANLLRLGAETARAIAASRDRDADTILRLAAQADVMAAELDGIADDDVPQPPAAFLLRRDK